jgi:hypothetical protein
MQRYFKSGYFFFAVFLAAFFLVAYVARHIKLPYVAFIIMWRSALGCLFPQVERKLKAT